MDILLIAAICIVTAIIAKVIQPTNRDLAAALSITAVAVAAMTAVLSLGEVVSGLMNTVGQTGISISYVNTAVKVLGICYICELSSSCCRDCGETALGGIIDISGRIAIAIICLPLIERFISVVKSILEL